MRPIRHLQERKRPVSPRGDQEVLPSGGRDESLQPVVSIVDAILSNQVERSLVSAHPGEEVGGWHEDRELAVRKKLTSPATDPDESGQPSAW